MDGAVSFSFMRHMYRSKKLYKWKTERQYYGSGGDFHPGKYCGWINKFFPYYQAPRGIFVENEIEFQEYKMEKFDTLKNFGSDQNEDEYPQGLSSAPVKWHDLIENKKYDLRLYSGITGYKQDQRHLNWSLLYYGLLDKLKNE